MTSMYGKLIELAKARDNSQWEIGDEILRLCPTGIRGNQDGSLSLLQEISEELAENGLDYTVDYIRALRRISEVFPNGERSPFVLWSIHQIAGSPKKLAGILRKAGKRNLTAALARELKKQLNEDTSKLIEKASLLKDLVSIQGPDIEFENDTERDMLKTTLIPLIAQLQAILNRIEDRTSHLRVIGD